jgi:hypothetical protein
MSGDGNKKVFLLGVGCQKGGTTWLHDYLSGSSEIDFGFMKEYHVFDALYLPAGNRIIPKKLKALQEGLNMDPPKLSENILQQFRFYLNVDNYFDYFDHLHWKSPGVSVVGDITPAYCGLPPDCLKMIKAKAEDHGFTVKVIFLLRDPVERVWSHLRMQKKFVERRGNRKLGDEEILARFYNAENIDIRTRYDKTIAALEAVFPSENIHYEFYESLFNDDAIRRVNAFLGVSHRPADFDRMLNRSPKENSTVSDDVIATIVNFYRDTYNFCFQKFGENRVRTLWQHARHLTESQLSGLQVE